MGTKLVLNGKKIGMLTYVEDAVTQTLPSGQSPRRVIVKCDCGNIKDVLLLHWIRGRFSSCGCYKPISKKWQDWLGVNFGGLTVISEQPGYRKCGRKIRVMKVICSCGNVIERKLDDLRYLKSCGCQTVEIIKEKLTIHGHCKRGARSKLYTAWQGIKNRCYNKNIHVYKWYGAKGVEVCSEWKENFISFYKWAVDNKWDSTLTLDRIDPYGNYCPENCRWATMKEQANNKRKTVRYEYNGEYLTIPELSKKYNLNRSALYQRVVLRNWSVEDAIIKSPFTKKQHFGKNLN